MKVPQHRHRFPVPRGRVAVPDAAELLRVSEATVRRRIYRGELSQVGHTSDWGVLLDRAEVEALAARLDAGELPRDLRKLTTHQGRKPSTPIAERRPAPTPDAETREASQDAPAARGEPAEHQVSPQPSKPVPTPWRPS